MTWFSPILGSLFALYPYTCRHCWTSADLSATGLYPACLSGTADSETGIGWLALGCGTSDSGGTCFYGPVPSSYSSDNVDYGLDLTDNCLAKEDFSTCLIDCLDLKPTDSMSGH